MIRETFFTDWHFMRWIRLGLGIIIAFQAIQSRDAFSGFIAAFFLFQAIANVGCCGGSNCSAPISNKKINEINEIQFSEVKIK